MKHIYFIAVLFILMIHFTSGQIQRVPHKEYKTFEKAESEEIRSRGDITLHELQGQQRLKPRDMQQHAMGTRCMPSLITYNEYGDDYRRNFTYDVSGNMLTMHEEYMLGSGWVNKNFDSYTYDDNGNVLTY